MSLDYKKREPKRLCTGSAGADRKRDPRSDARDFFVRRGKSTDFATNPQIVDSFLATGASCSSRRVVRHEDVENIRLVCKGKAFHLTQVVTVELIGKAAVSLYRGLDNVALYVSMAMVP